MSSSFLEKSTEKLIVSLVEDTLPLQQGQHLQVSKLTCGSSSTPSLYLQVPRQSSKKHAFTYNNEQETCDASHYLCEIQSIPTDFGSFLLTPSNTMVGKDSNLYLTTTVDPLFLVLRQEHSKAHWQPWDQIVQGMDNHTRAVLPADRNQLMHLFARMPVDDEEVYYKFSVAKALTWLKAKFDKVQATLLTQQQPREKISTKTVPLSTASNFHLGQQGTTTSIREGDKAKEEAQKQEKQQQQEVLRQERLVHRCRAEALQIVCDYLDETWKLRFLNHVNLDLALLQPALGSNKRPATDSTSSKSLPPPVPKKVKTAPVRNNMTAGQKKLAKVNTSGMKKMSAFFGVVKKENTPNKK